MNISTMHSDTLHCLTFSPLNLIIPALWPEPPNQGDIHVYLLECQVISSCSEERKENILQVYTSQWLYIAWLYWPRLMAQTPEFHN